MHELVKIWYKDRAHISLNFTKKKNGVRIARTGVLIARTEKKKGVPSARPD